MNNFNKDILISLMFMISIWGFIYDQFIFSAVLFFGTAIFSNMEIKAKLTAKSI